MSDLSKEIYPVENVKVIEVLEKIEQVEKDGDKVYWNKITEIKPKMMIDQYCYVKVIIKESDNKIIKEEILSVIDGRSRVDALTYWITIRRVLLYPIYTHQNTVEK